MNYSDKKDETTKRRTPKTTSIANSYTYYRSKGGSLYRPEYRKVFQHYLRTVSERLLDGSEVYIPKIGKLRVEGSKWRPGQDRWGPANTNWKATKKLWEENPELKAKQFVVYLNEHSGGTWYRLVWYPQKRRKHLKCYKMSPTDKFREQLSKRIFDGQEYVNS